jgi:RHS repeat-associated protein
MESDFGFAGMFVTEAGLHLTRFRAYDPSIGRWLARDPLDDAEFHESANLYVYVHNDPVNRLDPLGLRDCCSDLFDKWQTAKHIVEVDAAAAIAGTALATYIAHATCTGAVAAGAVSAPLICTIAYATMAAAIAALAQVLAKDAIVEQAAHRAYEICAAKGCGPAIC